MDNDYRDVLRRIASDSASLLSAATAHLEKARDIVTRGQSVIAETQHWLDVNRRHRTEAARSRDKNI
jgi:hypothetical protein